MSMPIGALPPIATEHDSARERSPQRSNASAQVTVV
jgi:hypothetical protein